jgi:hypothetical protein
MIPLIHAASFAERVAYHEAGHVAAALVLGVPIVSVTIDNVTPHMHRGHYRPSHDLGLECMVTLCLAGPAAEALFCGPITDGSDRVDIEMAREYLARWFRPALILFELARHRDAAERLVATPFARHRIPLIAAALIKCGTLTGDDIAGLT